jgi:hypothetical protein
MATALRNAPAALSPPGISAGRRDRFLSLSNIRYDPGDLAELRALQADLLPQAAVERTARAAKQVEVLAPNLSLFFRLPAVGVRWRTTAPEPLCKLQSCSCRPNDA